MAGKQEKEGWPKMFGEAFREMGLLYLVFGILDAQIESQKKDGLRLGLWWFAEIVVLSGVLWLFGAVLERTRKE